MDMAKPKIRFKGYTDEWEQRKLGEFAEKTFGGGTPKTSNESFWKGNIPWIQSSDLIEGSLFDVEPRKYISQEAVDKSATKLVPENSVAIVTRVGVGKLAFMPFSYATSQDFLSLSVLKTEPQFTVYALYKKLQLELNTVQGTSIKGVTKDELLTKEIMIPCYEEQEKIGSYLHSLDHLITLHQRKCEQAKKLKKYMLQKMFPQNGQKVPEIRFKGFTDDWEQRKLGDDLVSIHTGTNLLGSITNTGMPLIKMGNIQRGYFDTSKVEFLAENEQPDKADIVNYGDFFFNTRNTLELVGKGATWMKNSGEYAFNSNIARFELRNLDTIFFNYLYNTDYMTKQIHARAMGTTSVAAIYPSTLDSVEYLAPCMKEQQKIGAYFKQLDHLITLHQQKCDELKNIKKFMLQNMFM